MDEKNLWDQLQGEPDRAYARFLVYLHLGPSRSIDRAYQISSGTNRGKSGQWEADSSAYRWVDRAAAYDIRVLAPKLGSEVVVNWSVAAQELSRQLVEEILGGKLRPKNFEQALELFNVLSSFVTPETLEAVKQSVGGYFDTAEQPGDTEESSTLPTE